ncbi:Ribose import binding protein RbsB [bioreactor metagenome]|uniref:Ribose import binding protein RbsB n=1 Tax=bioreactor metagenome TaxID=1076179 RepID=A0A645GNX2_9ZZZZ
MILLQGIPGSSASRDRGQGFTDGISAYPNIKVVAKQTASFDRAKALDVATNLMQANPNVKAIFAENDEMALGAIEALGAKAGKDVKVVGFDGTADGLAAIQKGTLAATIAQQPAQLGSLAVEQAKTLLDGGQATAQIPVPVVTVTTANLADFKK